MQCREVSKQHVIENINADGAFIGVVALNKQSPTIDDIKIITNTIDLETECVKALSQSSPRLGNRLVFYDSTAPSDNIESNQKAGETNMSKPEHLTEEEHQLNLPLATRMRPKSLNEVVGQGHLIGNGNVLTRIVEARQMTSIILYGPPGIGKTSIAHALSGDLGVPFHYFNAGVHAKKQLQDIAKQGEPGKPVIVLVDEVHRLDKPKQDFLLMHIEEGSIIMVGATTENPYISINPALRSRSHIFELKEITNDDVVVRLRAALEDEDRGLGQFNAIVTDDQLGHIARQSSGDMRAALNAIELAVASTDADDNGQRIITDEIIDMCVQTRRMSGDKDGDAHYNLLSALQKSIRGSDVDASLHYLARLIKSGDLVSIIRRLMVIAYEDISLENPTYGPETLAAVTVAERVGFPEARIPLAQIVTRLALSPKSNASYKALDRALDALEDGRDMEIPLHLQDAHYKGAADLGRGVDYLYPHAFPYNITQQQYLPDAYSNDRYFVFRDQSDTPEYQDKYKKINSVVKP